MAEVSERKGGTASELDGHQLLCSSQDIVLSSVMNSTRSSFVPRLTCPVTRRVFPASEIARQRNLTRSLESAVPVGATWSLSLSWCVGNGSDQN